MNERQNISDAEIPREIMEIAPHWDIIRRENGKVYALVKLEPNYNISITATLKKVVYDETNGKIIENDEWKENSVSVLERLAITTCTVGLALPYLLNWWTQNKREDYQKTKEWVALCEELKKKNKADENQRLNTLAAPIRLYQGSIDEVERDLNMRLKRIDTQTPQTFLCEYDELNLRSKAAQLGANAVVHYRTQRYKEYYDEICHVGTPVKFIGPLYFSPHDIIVETRGNAYILRP